MLAQSLAVLPITGAGGDRNLAIDTSKPELVTRPAQAVHLRLEAGDRTLLG